MEEGFLEMANLSTADNITAWTYDELLKDANDLRAKLYLPVIVYISVAVTTGSLGNSLVIYIYMCRFRKTSSNYFILSVAFFDMVSCCIGMPIEIYDLLVPYMFYNSLACKAFRFAEAVTIIGSALILVAVAFDRYFKICQPLKMFPLGRIKHVCIGIAVAAFIVTLPTLLVFGLKRVEISTDYGNVTGSDCSLAGKQLLPWISPAWYGLMTLVFATSTLLMAGLYIRIWIAIRRRKRQVIGDQVIRPHFMRTDSVRSKSGSHKQSTLSNIGVKVLPSMSTSDEQDSSSGCHPEARPLKIKNSIRIRTSKTTVILFTVTVAFVLSYLPCLAVTILKNTKLKGQTLTTTMDVVMKLLSKSYFINNTINPVIYSFLNLNFRRECLAMMRKIVHSCLCCCTCQRDGHCCCRTADTRNKPAGTRELVSRSSQV